MTFGGLPTPLGAARGAAAAWPSSRRAGRTRPRPHCSTSPARRCSQHDFTVQQLWWDRTSRARGGSRAVAYAVTSRPRSWRSRRPRGASSGSRSAPAPRRTPPNAGSTPSGSRRCCVDPEVAEAIAANAGRQLLVGGLVDELWDAAVARALADAGCDVPRGARRRSRLATPDAVRAVEIHLSVARRGEAFLSSVPESRPAPGLSSAMLSRSSAVALGLEALEGGVDLGLGLDAADPVGALDGLAGLEVLVDLEEVLDLEPVELRDVVDVAQVLQARVVARARTAPCRRRRPRRSSGTCRSRGR